MCIAEAPKTQRESDADPLAHGTCCYHCLYTDFPSGDERMADDDECCACTLEPCDEMLAKLGIEKE